MSRPNRRQSPKSTSQKLRQHLARWVWGLWQEIVPISRHCIVFVIFIAAAAILARVTQAARHWVDSPLLDWAERLDGWLFIILNMLLAFRAVHTLVGRQVGRVPPGSPTKHRWAAILPTSVAIVACCLFTALALARARSATVETAHAFQEVSQLITRFTPSVNPQQLGRSIITKLREQVQDDTGALAIVESLTDRVNFTRLGADVLDEGLLMPLTAIVQDATTDSPLLASQLEFLVAGAYEELGHYEVALSHARRSHTLRRDHCGSSAAETLQAQARVGWLLFRLNRLDEAETELRASWALRERVLGPSDKRSLNSANMLAVVEKAMGRYDAAEERLLKVLEIAPRVADPHDNLILVIRNNLAEVYEKQGRYEDAEMQYRILLDVRRRTEKDDAPALTSLGALYQDWKRYDQAEPLLRSALGTLHKKYGDEHPETLICMEGLANLDRELGKYVEARELLDSVLVVRRRNLGDSNPSTLDTRHDIAVLDEAENRLDEAEIVHMDTLARRRSKLGDDHPDTLRSLENTARVLVRRGKVEQATSLVLELRAALKKRADSSKRDARAKAQYASYALTCEPKHLRQEGEALEYARECNIASEWKNAEYLDILARAQFANRLPRDAVTTQTRALSLLRPGDHRTPEFLDRLREYRAAANCAQHHEPSGRSRESWTSKVGVISSTP